MTLDSTNLVAFATLLTAVLGGGGIGHLLTARVNKAPDLQASLTAAVAGVIAHYTTALTAAKDEMTALRREIAGLREENAELKGEIAELRDKLEEQTETSAHLDSHVEALTSAMTKHGVTPPKPARTRRTPDKE